MANWRLIDRDALSGASTWHSYDPVTDETTIRTDFDEHNLDAVLDANKAAQNDGTNGYISREREFKRVAEIPVAIQHKWLVEEGIDINDKNAWPQIRRKLNSSEYLWLRTSPGMI